VGEVFIRSAKLEIDDFKFGAALDYTIKDLGEDLRINKVPFCFYDF
jgi:hypothetical protein